MRKFIVFLVTFLVAAGVWAPATQIFAQEENCISPEIFQRFELENFQQFEDMSPVKPTLKHFLEIHGLKTQDVQDYTPEPVVWEPGMFVVELDESLYGKFCLSLEAGYIYTVALADGRVEVLIGGDPELTEVPVLWGFTARYIPSYEGKIYGLGGWLSEDLTELIVREHRFGRYLRNEDMSDLRDDVPFFSRFGPYYTGTGNIDTDWVPPALTATVPRDYRDAAAMLGGLARKSEWMFFDNGVIRWVYTDKVSGSADYCSPNEPCWQRFYVPAASRGYVEAWHQGGPVKFYVDDDYAEVFVDEFSYHPYGDD